MIFGEKEMLRTLVTEAIVKRNYSVVRTIKELEDRYKPSDITKMYLSVSSKMESW